MVLRRSYLGVVGFIMVMGLMFLGAQAADAADYYWVGVDNVWATDSNWNTVAAGGGCVGGDYSGSVPGVGDRAIFDSNCTADVTITASTNIDILETQASYTGTITQAGTLDVDGAVIIVSSATLNSAGFDLTVGGAWTNSGTYTSGLNTVTFDGASGTQTVITGGGTANDDFNNVAIANTGSGVALSTNEMVVIGTFTINTGANFFTMGNNLTVTSTYQNNSGSLRMSGNETIILTAGMDTDSGETRFLEPGGGGRNLNLLTSFYDLRFEDSGGGTTWTMGANIDVNGAFRISGGTLDMNAFDINLAGNFWNQDTFTHNLGAVILDGSSQTIIGNTTFYDLTKSVSSTDTLALTASSTTTVTNALILNGAAGAILTVNSTTPGSAANLDVNGTATVSYLTVTDNTSAGSVTPSCTAVCINGGGNTGWRFASTGSTANVANSVTAATLSSPNGGETLEGGSLANITWSVGGDDVDAIKLSYSVDNGQTYTVIATDEENDGTYSWTVPNVDSPTVMVKVTGITASGSDVISDTSNQNFTITANPDLADEVVDNTPPDTEVLPTVVAMTDADGNEVNLVEGSLFRGVELSGVYYVKDGTRYVFPNEAVFFSHGYSFDDVVTVKDDQLRKLMVGGRMIMAEGTMIKIQSDNKTYQVQADGVLAHVPDEATAIALYGPTWNKQITDISVAFWFDYTVGSALASQQ